MAFWRGSNNNISEPIVIHDDEEDVTGNYSTARRQRAHYDNYTRLARATESDDDCLIINRDEFRQSRTNQVDEPCITWQPYAYQVRPSQVSTQTRPLNGTSLFSTSSQHVDRDVRANEIRVASPDPVRRQSVGIPSHQQQPSTTNSTELLGALNTREQGKPLQLRSKYPQCTECADQGIACDGLEPCAYCAEPGFECRYPGRESTAQTLQGTVTMKSAAKTNASCQDTPARDKWTVDPHSSLPTNNRQKSGRAALNLYSGTMHIIDHTPSRLTDNGWLPRSMDDMIKLVKAHQENINLHRQYLLESQLLQAKRHSQKRSLISTHDTASFVKSPFQERLRLARLQSSLSDGSSTTTMKVRASRGKGKNFTTITLRTRPLPIVDEDMIMPRTKSIGRLGTSFLTRNVHTLKYFPYFADEEGAPADNEAEQERKSELRDRYRESRFMNEIPLNNEFVDQRRCAETVQQWQGELMLLLDELQLTLPQVAAWVEDSPAGECDICDLKPQSLRIPSVTLSLGPAEKTRCQLLHAALLSVIKIPLWHFLHYVHKLSEKQRSIGKKTDTLEGITKVASTETNRLCSICFVYNCLTHGAFVDGGDEVNDDGVFIDDPEDENNTRRSVDMMTRKDHEKVHRCGFFCIDRLEGQKCSLQQLISSIVDARDSTDLLQFGSCEVASPKLDILNFKGKKHCSPNCFLVFGRRQARAEFHESLTKCSSTQRLQTTTRSLLGIYGQHVRLPCVIAQMTKTDCSEALSILLQVHQEPSHCHASDTSRPSSTTGLEPKTARGMGTYNTEQSSELDNRGPILPCQHDGPCVAGSDCACAKDKIHCERFCGCSKDCRRRFKGCDCAVQNASGVCFKDDKCACWANNRECDPWVCGRCGVLEVLDPVNKYNLDVRKGKCQNNMLQLDLPAKTVQARSEVQGWGLYAGEDLDRHAFIGEYKGEIISAGRSQEADRRGIVYHKGGLEYLFTINQEQEIDGSSFGNKTRFMNNSQLDKHINVDSKKLIANGVQRVLFYARRAIKAGEELLYNYNYPDSVVAGFWERGEQPAAKTFVTPAKPKLSKRVARQAGAVTENRQVDALRGLGRDGNDGVRSSRSKRKRHDTDSRGSQSEVEGNSDHHDSPDGAISRQLNGDLSRFQNQPAGRGRRAFISGRSTTEANSVDSEGDDYKEQDDDDDDDEEAETESQTESADSASSSSVEPPPVNPRNRPRLRKINAGDRRRGGEAQRRAAITRRENQRLRNL